MIEKIKETTERLVTSFFNTLRYSPLQSVLFFIAITLLTMGLVYINMGFSSSKSAKQIRAEIAYNIIHDESEKLKHTVYLSEEERQEYIQVFGECIIAGGDFTEQLTNTYFMPLSDKSEYYFKRIDLKGLINNHSFDAVRDTANYFEKAYYPKDKKLIIKKIFYAFLRNMNDNNFKNMSEYEQYTNWYGNVQSVRTK